MQTPSTPAPADAAQPLPFQAQVSSNEPFALHLNAKARAIVEYLTSLRDSGSGRTLTVLCNDILKHMALQIDPAKLPRLESECSLGWLADETSRCVGHVHRAVHLLESVGLLHCLRRGGKRGNQGEPSRYLLIPKCALAQRANRALAQGANSAQARYWGAKKGLRQRAVGPDSLSVFASATAIANAMVEELKKEGFEDVDAIALAAHPNCSAEQLEIARKRYEWAKARGKVRKTKLAYLRDAIQQKYLPPMTAEQRRQAAEPEHRQEDLSNERQQRAERDAAEKRQRAAVAALAPGQFEELRRQTMADLPPTVAAAVSKWANPLDSPTLVAEMFRRLPAECHGVKP